MREMSGLAAVAKGRAMWGLSQMSLQGHPRLPGPPTGTLKGLQGFGTSLIMNRVCASGANACGWRPRDPQFLGKNAASRLEGGPRASCFLLSWRVAAAGGQRNGPASSPSSVLRPPPSALHPGSSTLKQTRWGLSSRGTQLTVCVPAGGQGGAPAVPAVPGRCPFALSQGGRRIGTRASEHHKATYCAPGTTDQETRQSRPSGARPRRREASSTAGPQHPTPQAFTRHLLCCWHPTLPGVSMPRPCL